MARWSSGVIVVITTVTAPAIAAAALAPPPPPRLPAPHRIRRQSDETRLERRDDGSLRYVDREANFVGIIEPDGRVRIRDTPGIEPDLRTGVETMDWVMEMGRAVVRPGPHDRPDLETPAPEDGAAKADAAAERMPPSPYGPAPILVSLGVRMGGLSDLLLRRGQRKNVRAKQAFLDQTAPMRDAMLRRESREQQQAAMLMLGQLLATVWRDRSLSVEARKRAVFEWWDECEEAQPGVGPDEAERRAQAEQMRRRIERFVRRVAPPGQPMAYTRRELQRLNAGRQSRQRFEPYAPMQTRAASGTGSDAHIDDGG